MNKQAPKTSMHDLIFAIRQVHVLKAISTLNDISNPLSTNFRKYLSREEVGVLTANKTSTNEVLNYFYKAKSKINFVSLYGEFISVKLPVRDWEKILNTTFELLPNSKNGHQDRYYVRAGEYSLPREIDMHIMATFNIDQYFWRNPCKKRLKFQSAKRILSNVMAPRKINKSYRITRNKGSNKTSQSAFATVNQFYSPSDLRKFQELFHLPIQDVYTSFDPNHAEDYLCLNDVSRCIESNLDLQYLMATCQVTPTSLWYVDAGYDTFVTWIVSVNNQSVPQHVHSISFGGYEDSMPVAILDAFNLEAIKAGLQGVTILVASGDDGVVGYQSLTTHGLCGYNPMFPASSPWVTAVGGTMGLEKGDVETACRVNAGALITSGGGFSKYFDAPKWQLQSVREYFRRLPADKRPHPGYRVRGRAYPDVSLAAVDYPVVVGGEIYLVSGTSASTPVVSGMISLINSELLEAGLPPVGFVNPILYASKGAFANDVTVGENHCSASARCCKQGFHATPGWDPVTGFGSVDFLKLRALLHPIRYNRNHTYVDDLARWKSANLLLVGHAHKPGYPSIASPKKISINTIVIITVFILVIICWSRCFRNWMRSRLRLQENHDSGERSCFAHIITPSDTPKQW